MPPASSKAGTGSKEQEKESASLMETFKAVQDRHAEARANRLRRRSLLAQQDRGREGTGEGEGGSN